VRTVGPVSNTDGALSPSETIGGGDSSWNWTTCQRALTVGQQRRHRRHGMQHKRSDSQADSAVNIAHQIAAKVPKQ
jgi:hypothetical protein